MFQKSSTLQYLLIQYQGNTFWSQCSIVATQNDNFVNVSMLISVFSLQSTSTIRTRSMRNSTESDSIYTFCEPTKNACATRTLMLFDTAEFTQLSLSHIPNGYAGINYIKRGCRMIFSHNLGKRDIN